MNDTMLYWLIYRTSRTFKCSVPNAIEKNNAIMNKSSCRRTQSQVSFGVSDQLYLQVLPSSVASVLRSVQV